MAMLDIVRYVYYELIWSYAVSLDILLAYWLVDCFSYWNMVRFDDRNSQIIGN